MRDEEQVRREPSVVEPRESGDGVPGDGASGSWGPAATRAGQPSSGRGDPNPATPAPPPGAREDGAAGGGGEPPQTGPDEAPAPRPAKRRSFWRELPVLVIVALGLALLIKTFAVQAFFIPSSSMEGTLDIGDRVLVNKIVYHTRPIHRGDVVVFNGLDSWDPSVPQTPPSSPARRVIDWIGAAFGVSAGEKDYIKRVIGVPGDHVQCCDARGRVTVNGVPLSEGSYLYPGNAPSATPFSITVPPGRLWVMGDHRAVSYDSRQHLGDPGGGSIPENKIVGRAFMIVWPANRLRILPIPSTFEQKTLSASGRVGQVTRAAASAAPAAPAVLGFAGAVPLTLLQRRLRISYRRRREGRRR
jgi:signal peptidase I